MKISEGKAGRPVKTRRRVAVNLYLLDESEKSLVFFGNESYKYKERADIVLTKSFCFFLIRKKKFISFG